MKRISALVAAFLLTGCTSLNRISDWSDTIEAPPAGWDHKPNMPVTEIVVPFPNIDATCHGLLAAEDDPDHFRGCALVSKNACIIVIPTIAYFVSVGMQVATRHHEYAHCNGLVHGPGGHGWFTRQGVPVS